MKNLKVKLGITLLAGTSILLFQNFNSVEEYEAAKAAAQQNYQASRSSVDASISSCLKEVEEQIGKKYIVPHLIANGQEDTNIPNDPAFQVCFDQNQSKEEKLFSDLQQKLKEIEDQITPLQRVFGIGNVPDLTFSDRDSALQAIENSLLEVSNCLYNKKDELGLFPMITDDENTIEYCLTKHSLIWKTQSKNNRDEIFNSLKEGMKRRSQSIRNNLEQAKPVLSEYRSLNSYVQSLEAEKKSDENELRALHSQKLKEAYEFEIAQQKSIKENAQAVEALEKARLEYEQVKQSKAQVEVQKAQATEAKKNHTEAYEKLAKKIKWTISKKKKDNYKQEQDELAKLKQKAEQEENEFEQALAKLQKEQIEYAQAYDKAVKEKQQSEVALADLLLQKEQAQQAAKKVQEEIVEIQNLNTKIWEVKTKSSNSLSHYKRIFEIYGGKNGACFEEANFYTTGSSVSSLLYHGSYDGKNSAGGYGSYLPQNKCNF